jgi:hypothetical protein
MNGSKMAKKLFIGLTFLMFANIAYGEEVEKKITFDNAAVCDFTYSRLYWVGIIITDSPRTRFQPLPSLSPTPESTAKYRLWEKNNAYDFIVVDANIVKLISAHFEMKVTSISDKDKKKAHLLGRFGINPTTKENPISVRCEDMELKLFFNQDDLVSIDLTREYKQ